MNCETVREKLIACLESDPPLAAAERAELEAHLAGCPACRAESEALRGQIALLRAAGGWARGLGAGARLPAASSRPSPGRMRGPRARRNGKRRRRLSPAWLVAAAALLALALGAWKLLPGPEKPGGPGPRNGEEPPGRLIAGNILEGGQPATLLASGRRYVVPPGPGAEIELRGDATVWVRAGSSFEVPGDFDVRPGLRVLSGGLRCSSNAPFMLRGARLSARACGSFALATSAAAPPAPSSAEPVSAAWSDWLFPRAFAAETPAGGGHSGPEAFLLWAGWAEVRVNGARFRLEGYQAAVGGDGAAHQSGAAGKLLADMIAERKGLLEGLLTPRYRAMIAEYSARRADYVKRLAAAKTEEEKADLNWRMASMKELSAAHAARLPSLAKAEGARLHRAELLAARIRVLSSLLDGANGSLAEAGKQ